MNKTLIITDMDGTLLDKSQQISKENEMAIKRFIERGGLFTLATGRMESSVLPYIRQLELELPVILYNGAKIYSPVSGKTLSEKRIAVPRPAGERFLEWLDDRSALLVYRQGEVFAPVRNEVLERHERKDGVRCKPLNGEWPEEPVTKILFIAPPEKLAALESVIAQSGIAGETVRSEADYLELLPAGATKGHALRELVGMLKTDGLYTVAIGDNMNDAAMLMEADCGIAVENAPAPLKMLADAITVHHERHAIARVIGEIMRSADGRYYGGQRPRIQAGGDHS